MHTLEELQRLRDAYRLLGVPTTAPAATIKRAYRALAKEWHPDRAAEDTGEHAQAVASMTQLNTSYALIRHAPLRYHVSSPNSSQPRVEVRGQSAGGAHRYPVPPSADTMPFGARTQFWLRFIGGGLGGAFFSLPWLIASPVLTPSTLTGYGVTAVVIWLCTLRWGPRFWEVLLRMAVPPWR